MLYSLDDPHTALSGVPKSRAANFGAWTGRLTATEQANIKAHINAKVDKAGDTFNASWLPGADWEGTALDVIYTKACGLNEEAAAKCFGLFVWLVMTEREDDWSFVRLEGENDPAGMTYFRRKSSV